MNDRIPISSRPGVRMDWRFLRINGSEMSPGANRNNWYQRGIRRAEQDGLIHYACQNAGNQFAASDDYGHICPDHRAPLLLKYTNTRPLAFIARQILNLYRDHPEVRFLEIGPGAGVACATVNRLLPGAEIDTISLTPLNPYLRFHWDDLYDHLPEPVSREACALRFYSACCPPFVRNQYIGKFPREVRAPEASHHFIYEDHGALFYNFQPDGSGEAPELAPMSIASALSLLRRNGTM